MSAERLEMGFGQDKPEDGILANLWKYFAHGLVFALIMLGFPFIVNVIILGAIYGGSLSAVLGGLALVFIILLFGVGFFNGQMAHHLWSLNPKRTLTSWLGQGFLVLMMIPLFGYIYMMFMFPWVFGSLPAVLATVVLFFLDAIVSGYIGKHVAAEFEEQREGEEELASIADRHVPCPHCGSLFMCRNSMIGPNREAICPHCQEAVVVPVEGPRPEHSDREWKPESSRW
ncbi:MAG: hypothetical protein KAJ96_01675 [Candidatus Thorarchaeota archaeon]|nr:hypothetical protein [Candidatus Thorarchaeota archaeon]